VSVRAIRGGVVIILEATKVLYDDDVCICIPDVSCLIFRDNYSGKRHLPLIIGLAAVIPTPLVI
jgi:hypothetical protein